MEGYIVNNSGKHRWVFKRKFPLGHKIMLADLWEMYKKRIKNELGKSNVSEEDFIGWLKDRGSMLEGFIYYPGDKTSFPGDITGTTEGNVYETGTKADGRLVKPSLATASKAVIEKLSFTDIANLRLLDNPQYIIESITNIHKLRRAYTKVRSMPRKGHLQRVLRDRLQELERLQ